jgi:hypothetical protein
LTSEAAVQHRLAREASYREHSIANQELNATMDLQLDRLLKFFVNTMQNQCLVCKIRGMEQCGSQWKDHKDIKRDVEGKRKTLNYLVSPKNPQRTNDQTLPKYIICYGPGCFVPKHMCNKQSGGCVYADILLDVVHILMRNRQIATKVHNLVGGEEKMYRLLTTLSSRNNKNILLHEVFLMLCNEHNLHGLIELNGTHC